MRKIGRVIRLILYAMKLVRVFCPWLFFLLILSSLLRGLTPTATVYVSKYVINSIADVIKTGVTAERFNHIMLVLTIQSLCLTGLLLFDKLSAFFVNLMSVRLSLAIKSDVLDKISCFDMACFDNPKFHDMRERAMRDAGERSLALATKMSGIFSGLVTFISMSILFLSFCRPLIFLMPLLCIPFAVVQVYYNQSRYNMLYQRAHDARMGNLLSNWMTDRQSIPEITSYGLWGYLHQRWYSYFKDFMQKDVHLERKRTVVESCVLLSNALVKLLVAIFIVRRGLTMVTPLSIGAIVMYINGFTSGVTGLGKSLENISGMYLDTLHLNDYREFTKLKPVMQVKATPREIPDRISSLDIRGVSFHYTGCEGFALQDINLCLQKGQNTLIIGANGAGKTTLIKLLIRLYDPDDGEILLNGIDIREFDPLAYRSIVGVLFQDFLRLPFSARENIGMGYVQSISDDGRIQAAARKARIDDTIQSLPYQYETILNRQFRNGCEVSYGQWQRISIARLFMKQSPILILDEPTASLDIETEVRLLHEVTGLSQQKICLMISHRIFREGVANRIVVLDQGRIIEEGDHVSLTTTNSKYAQLWNLYHHLPTADALH